MPLVETCQASLFQNWYTKKAGLLYNLHRT